MDIIIKKNTSTGKWETFVPDIDGFRIETFYSYTYEEALEIRRRIKSGEIPVVKTIKTFEKE